MSFLSHSHPRHRFLLVYAVIVCGAAGVAVNVWPVQWCGITMVLAVALVAAWLVARLSHWSLRRRLRELRETTDAIGQGDLTRQIESYPNDDFVKLAQSLNRVADQLKKNVRERDQLRQQLTRSEKLALIGELAATVAHEVNNPLDGLQNSTRIIRRNLDNTEQVRRLLDLMDAGLYRIEMIVRQLLTMSRDEPINPAPTRVDEMIDDAVRFIRPKLERYGVNLVIDVPETLLFAQADRMQLVQALINLMINAIDAMSDAACDGRKLTLRCRAADDGRKAQLDMIDTGTGIRSDDLPHIFEPFYSTKAKGVGTGLGLAVVKRVIEAHRGTITVDSQPGLGTRFRIKLPIPVPQIEPSRLPDRAAVPQQRIPDTQRVVNGNH